MNHRALNNGEFLDLHVKEVAAPWNQQSERKFNWRKDMRWTLLSELQYTICSPKFTGV